MKQNHKIISKYYNLYFINDASTSTPHHNLSVMSARQD